MSRLLIPALLGAAFLAGCHRREVKVEETPIMVVSESPGRGRTATEGRIVDIDYEVKLPDGEVVLRHKNWRFLVGSGSVIVGMDEAVRGMSAGGRRVVECPPHKHWGRTGYADGAIPPHTPLYFHIKMNRVE